MRRMTGTLAASMLAGCTDGGTDLIETIELTGGMVYTCGLDAAGSVSCWGSPMEPDEGTPEQPYPDTIFTQIDADAGNTCGLRDDGTATCWGGAFEEIDEISAATDLTQISMGRYDACGLHEDGSVSCWGVDIEPPAGPFAQISTGADIACGVTLTGELDCWGDILYASFLDNAPSGDIVSVDVSGVACALDAGGAVTCWDESSADLGLLSGVAVTAMETGAGFVCGLTDDGSIVCDGDDGEGQTSPPDGAFETFGLGYDHGCASGEDGVICWGSDGNGQSSP